MNKKVTIVPCDKVTLVDNQAVFHGEDFHTLNCPEVVAHLKPKFCIHSVEFDPDTGYAIIQWQQPKNTILTREQFFELFGHCVTKHEEVIEEKEKVRKEWEAKDREQTARIEANNNK